MSKSYLIRRDVKLTDAGSLIKKNKVLKFTETIISRRNVQPASDKLEKNDIIYVAEKGGEIYAKCIVIEKYKIFEWRTLAEALKFYNETKEKIDQPYFLSRLSKFSKQLSIDSSYTFKFQFYEVEQNLLSSYVPLTGALSDIKKDQSSLIILTQSQIDYINNSNVWIESDLDEKIPSALRLKIYSFFSKQKGIGHLIDIDHFVPKSLGGPGNVIENIIPIGFGLNRYKSDSIPRGFFQVAQEYFNQELQTELKNALKNSDEYFSNSLKSNHSELAKKIIKKLHNKENYSIIEAKEFYKSVLKIHHPEYVQFINEYK
ncbi:MAG TPA: hypothetical protein VIN72_05660 [Lutibacter sp.]